MEDEMRSEEQTHSDDMNVLNYLLRTVRGLRPVSTDDISNDLDEDISFS
jgi:hypothetical protein